MIQCSACGFDNSNDVSACERCGRLLPVLTACEACGQGNPHGSWFCSGCGHRLLPVPNGMTPFPLHHEEPQSDFESEVPVVLSEPSTPPWPAAAPPYLQSRGWDGSASPVARSAEDPDGFEMEQSLVGLPGHEASELVRETGGGAVIESSLALADCMTDRGSGPALSVRALALSEFDVDSLAGVLAKVIAAPPIVYEIDKHRPVWQPRGRQPQGKG